MIDIKTAQELYKISQTKAPEIVAGILEGVREHIIQRCEEEANEGATYYSIYLKKGLFYTKDLLLEKCIKIAKEFKIMDIKYLLRILEMVIMRILL